MTKRRQPDKSSSSKKTVQYTKTLRERMLLFSGKKQPRVNARDSQTLCYESSMECRIAKHV